ncbi:3-phosphoshikimate 1-carboxyvinyltransferase [Flavobacterium sp. CS20]|uniref:3-phosphoshikimate 1-carboxyvinyltransferase n=1 Tax=Flavobacterium sp. CS20 TaxID=2775246 RepID=UPI001B3A4235|nr:3-phosphoshikimate 1-carboxyvinyltransferase [Flavobacterium sp. CS20]QTY28098.1 3-phosphoshikimate 1-carboxyvinyltransferase [Flavobacterium sp. CS20]
MKTLLQKTLSGDYSLNICGSKSESNRLLIIQALFKKLNIDNLSTSDDTMVLKAALASQKDIIDIHHAGTAMRFLTAYYACFTNKSVTLTGSKRMQNRPIKILVDALRQIGAKIDYINKEGFPPLKIQASNITSNKIEIQANTSSQYISALMLVAPKLKNGLKINFTSKITSLPYLKMTYKMMQNLGFEINFDHQSIEINPKTDIDTQKISVESDWSSASYYYSLVALSPSLKLKLSIYKNKSLQGDSKISELYKELGVQTTFEKDAIILENSQNNAINYYNKNLNHTPDLAQTIAVTCLGLKISCNLTGLHTLKIKETDRLVALKNELEKFGATVEIDHESLKMTPPDEILSHQTVKTYNDHRMAMAFAPLITKTELKIENSKVVSKSYPDFWKDFESLY